MARLGKTLAGSLLLIGVEAGCGGSYDDGGSAGAGTKYASKRSLTCRQWQDAMCDFIADECQAQTRPECDELYQSLFCRDDATMSACLGALGSASCASPAEVPVECREINDAAPVLEYCKDFGREVCKWGVRCQQATDQAACESQVALDLSDTCAAGVGLSSSADQCLTDLQTHACGSEGPASCKGVIKLLSGG